MHLFTNLLTLSVAFVFSMVGCGSTAVPDAVKVLENPVTGERVRFFSETRSSQAIGRIRGSRLGRREARQQLGLDQRSTQSHVWSNPYSKGLPRMAYRRQGERFARSVYRLSRNLDGQACEGSKSRCFAISHFHSLEDMRLRISRRGPPCHTGIQRKNGWCPRTPTVLCYRFEC